MTIPAIVFDARRYFRGQLELAPDAMIDAAYALMRAGYFQLARRLLDEYAAGLALDPDTGRSKRRTAQEIARLHAYVTYRDRDLPEVSRFETALRMLRDGCGLDGEGPVGADVLSVASAVRLERWTIHGRYQDLLSALAYCELGIAGGASGPSPDPLVAALAARAAYCLDMIAGLSSQGLVVSREMLRAKARAYREQAIALARDDLDGVDPERRFLHLFAVGEAHFGLGHFGGGAGDPGSAFHYLALAREAAAGSSWVLLAEVPVLVRTAELLSLEGWEAELAACLGVSPIAIESLRRGRVGLALSGGGLRAALFHIGLLAQLAERDLLRKVEVLSCVSGGAILGTYYYLWLRKLLEAKTDADLTRDDYVELVKVVEERFLAAVQTNLRMRLLAEGWPNFERVVTGRFDTSERFAHILDEALYRPIDAAFREEAGRFGVAPVAEANEPPVYLDEIRIDPKRPAGARFHRGHDNVGRASKVPELVLNATTTNTGHDFQFTATYMGEPPRPVPLVLDSVPRLRRFYYTDAAKGREPVRMPIARAVAASSCIPGLFPPVDLGELYPGYQVTLSDGGVHDNQGLAPLFESGCRVLIISDASGQAEADVLGETGVFHGALRANDILMQRVRELQYEELSVRREAGLVRSFTLVHLTQGLGAEPVDWTSCEDPYRRVGGAYEALEERRKGTEAGLRRSVLRALARLRTDLDVHTDVEAHGLMSAAYHACAYELGQETADLLLPERAPRAAFRFRAMDPFVRVDAGEPTPEALEHVLGQLRAGRRRFFRFLPGARRERPARPPILDVGGELWGVLALVFGLLPAKLALHVLTPRMLRAGAVPPVAPANDHRPAAEGEEDALLASRDESSALLP